MESASALSCPSNEKERLERLRSYSILDTPKDSRLDHLTEFATDIFSVPNAFISLLEEDREWFLSCAGFGVTEVDRESSFGNSVLLENDVLIIEDVFEDDRFTNIPLLQEKPEIRSYAGAPIITDEGFIIGTFSLLDNEPRTFSDCEVSALKSFTSEAMRQIDHRFQKQKYKETNDQLRKQLREAQTKAQRQKKRREELLHRLKNHFVETQSWLSQQKSRVENEEAYRSLEVAETRLYAFLNLHEHIEHATNTTTIETKEYLNNIVKVVVEIFENQIDTVRVNRFVENHTITSQLGLNLGIALSELITNAYQHVFIPMDGDELSIRFQKNSETYRLTVRDNGPGLRGAEESIDSDENSEAFPDGLDLIRNLIDYEVEGNLSYSNDDGSVFTVEVPVEVEQ